MPMTSAREIITIVDEDNNETGKATRKQMREENLIHRATYILVFNSQGEIFVSRRTASKDIYPSHYEIAAGGVVLAGESYELSAHRELEEELGLTDCKLSHLFDNFYDDDNNRVWGRIFSCINDGPMILQEEEVENGQFMAIDKVLDMMNTHPFCPDGVGILQRTIQRLKSSTSNKPFAFE